MDYAPIQHFLYSQQWFTALRMTIGTVLPALVLVFGFNLIEPGIACAIGAMCVCLIDLPGELSNKHHEMLIAAFMVSLIALLTACAQAHFVLLWPTILLMSFCGAFATAFGHKASIIGTNAVLVMVLGLAQRGPLSNTIPYLTGLAAGAFWYVYYCLAVCTLFKHQMARRALAECLFATAAYLAKHSTFYDPSTPLEQCYQPLHQHITLQDTQQKARDLVLTKQLNSDSLPHKAQHIKLFNLFVDAIDLHNTMLAAHTDFSLLRAQWGESDSLLFIRDLLSKFARELVRVAQAVVYQRTSHSRENGKAEWRALAYDLQQLRQTRLHTISPKTYAILSDSVEKVGQIKAIIDKMHNDTTSTNNTTKLNIDNVVKLFSTNARLFALPTPSYYNPAWRYALRFTLAMLAALAVGALLPGSHDNWILLTVVVALRPGFGQSRQRSHQRLFGTLAGCGAAMVLLIANQNHYVLFAVMVLSLLFSFSLMQLTYLGSVFFTSVAVILVYHWLAPAELHLIQERAADTLIGAAIAAVSSYLFPFWESQLIKPQISSLRQRSLQYLGTLASEVEDELICRAAKRDILAALAKLSTSYQNMLLEPRSTRLQETAVNTLRLTYHVFIAQITALHYRLMTQPALRHCPAVAATLAHASEALQGSITKPSSTSSEEFEHTAYIDHNLHLLPQTSAEIYRLTADILHTSTSTR